jgi:hypothetical protein
MVELKNWSVQVDPNPYAAPETKALFLVGEVYGHPAKMDGKMIKTSRIQSSDGLNVTTQNRTYILVGPPDPKWIQWLKDNNLDLPDSHNPIRMKK